MIDLVIEVGEVEAIGDIVFVYFTKVLVPLAAEKPGYP